MIAKTTPTIVAGSNYIYTDGIEPTFRMLYASTHGFDPDFTSLGSGARTSQVSDVILKLGNPAEMGTLSGVVTSGSSPLAEVTISLVDTNRSTTTDEAGEYTFGLLNPGTYHLRAEKSNYTTFDDETVVINAGQITTLSFNMSPDVTLGNLSGEVRSGGEPVADVTITLVGTDFSTTTDAAGVFHIENLPPITYHLQAEKFGYETFIR